jgi:glycosyltransferase EpsE
MMQFESSPPIREGRPAVSVIMSVYDGVSLPELDEAISSICDQSLRDFEFLIMQDDVRRADLIGRLQHYADNDPRVKLFVSDGRIGLATALNRLLKSASAPYVARMDADDVSMPTRLEHQVAFLNEHEDVMVLGTMAREIDSSGRAIYEKTLPTADADIRAFQCYRDPFVHPSVMFRRTLFDLVGSYSEDPRTHFLEDTDLWSRTLLAGLKTANLPEFLFCFRVNAGLYSRRGGFTLAYRELAMRWSYVRRGGFSWYNYLPAIGTAIMRAGPAALRRRLYSYCRGGTSIKAASQEFVSR